ncbi:hypothetical protein A2619_05700 [candidate division WWE3 bacterium RIFOXYD1_FULL_39_9]|uniref:Uncharacterized protein n=1 Tax=candidate division WWE3 bacterium RIFOXYD1_FULL_39_9 TaxID=1802649 RepID=A0A1F4X9A8_UNCKA|nr:MAG: hypothetical protein A2619_05700 [candidate division WWE3 bacterium RIFOXYD1_FULL_39_9]
MIGPIAVCQFCNTSWDTWIGYECPTCHKSLPEDQIEAYEREHQATFRSMLQSLPFVRKPKPWWMFWRK